MPDYQRGYRWGKHEVLRLLQDVSDSEGDYYLQPIVVRARPDSMWELVDGQQRLTTLYLVMQYLRQHLPSAQAKYTLQYETRPDSQQYLIDLDESRSQQNLDYFHIFGAYQCIREWFEGQPNPLQAAIDYYTSLSRRVRVIWYEAPSHLDQRELFRRLNVGRIPLTDAELVKALLLSRSHGVAGIADRAQELAAQWDTIERDLRIPELWAFATGQADDEATHLGLLLDTLAGGQQGGTDRCTTPSKRSGRRSLTTRRNTSGTRSLVCIPCCWVGMTI